MFKRLLAVVAGLCICAGAHAQFARDTLAAPVFRASQLIAPVTLGAAGAALHFIGHEAVEVPVRSFVQGIPGAGPSRTDFTSYVRWTPVALHLGLGLVGADSRRPFLDRTIEDAISYGFALGGGYLLKKAFRGERPGGGEFDSFPSGHAVIAFTGAELMRMDYGWGWGSGAYVLATAIGAERLWSDRHWLGDVLAGAGFGILCAHAGEWLLGPFKSLFGIPDVPWDGLSRRRTDLAFRASSDPVSGTPLAGVVLSF